MSSIVTFILIYLAIVVSWGLFNLFFFLLTILLKKMFILIPVAIQVAINWVIQIFTLCYPLYLIITAIISKNWSELILILIIGVFVIGWWQFIINAISSPVAFITLFFANFTDEKLGIQKLIDEMPDLKTKLADPKTLIKKHTNSGKRAVTSKFIDINNNKYDRASGQDFDTLPSRHIEILRKIPGLEKDDDIDKLLGKASHDYEQGNYDQALHGLENTLDKIPKLEPYIFYYIRVCRRVLSIPLTKHEKEYKKKLDRYLRNIRILPKWLKWIEPEIPIYFRCKWCGRYTQYINPDYGVGYMTKQNSCSVCKTPYPMPSWMWDSPDGRAYSYYRQSFSHDKAGENFYNEFLNDYNPKPTVENSGFFTKK